MDIVTFYNSERHKLVRHILGPGRGGGAEEKNTSVECPAGLLLGDGSSIPGQLRCIIFRSLRPNVVVELAKSTFSYSKKISFCYFVLCSLEPTTGTSGFWDRKLSALRPKTPKLDHPFLFVRDRLYSHLLIPFISGSFLIHSKRNTWLHSGHKSQNVDFDYYFIYLCTRITSFYLLLCLRKYY